MSTAKRTLRHVRTGFSLVEMLMALAISVTLLTATLQALDASWRGYKQVSESASVHVVSRIVVHRVLAMIRTGTAFSPVPADVLDAGQNPLVSNSIEFLAEADRQAANGRRTRLERRSPAAIPGQFELWYVLLQANGTIIDERPLMRSVRDISFILEYDVGPRLMKATVDLTVWPNDDDAIQVDIGDALQPIRIVASATPRAQ